MEKINRFTLLNLQKWIEEGDKTRAISFMHKRGLSQESIDALMKQAGYSGNIADEYLVEEMLRLLPHKHSEAVRLLRNFYEISEVFAQEVMTPLVDKDVVSREMLRLALEQLKPGHVSDRAVQQQSATGSLNAKLLAMLDLGKIREATNLLIDKHQFEAEEAEEYLQDLQNSKQRQLF